MCFIPAGGVPETCGTLQIGYGPLSVWQYTDLCQGVVCLLMVENAHYPIVAPETTRKLGDFTRVQTQ